MTLLYADSSALVRAYFDDEPDHLDLEALLLGGRDPVVTSEIARVELASAVRAASAGGRLSAWREVLARVDADLGENGPIEPIDLRPDIILPAAYSLVVEHRLRTLDAIHLAVCAEECPRLASGGEIVFVTRDDDQAKAARSLGFSIR